VGTNKAWAGANDRVRIGVIGIHGMGQNHIKAYTQLPDVEVVALCDIDSNLCDPVIKKLFTDKGLKAPRTYTDLRKLYEDKEIDAVVIVTPNHWHTLAAIWAMQAGKHVTVEKPCCHNIYEGQKLETGASGSGLGDHYANFAEAIRSADPKTFSKGVENGFNTCAVIHLGNISCRLGRSLEFDPQTMRFPHDDEANSMLTREYRAPFIVPEKV